MKNALIAIFLFGISINTFADALEDEKARSIQITNNWRAKVEQEIANNPSMPEYQKAQLRAFKLVGPEHIENYARSAEIQQKIADIEAIKANPKLAAPIAKSYFATSGSAPFDNIGNSGRTINKTTGEIFISNQAMADAYDYKELSNARKNIDLPTNSPTARCRDGTYSFSQSRRGTCSHHGGVYQWM